MVSVHHCMEDTDAHPRPAAGMRLPEAAHTARPWRVHALTQDFEVEDVWRLPTPGGPDDLARLVEQFAAPDDDRDELPAVVRALFALRWKLGELLGLDEDGTGLEERVPSLRERLPADLRDGSRGRTPGVRRERPPTGPLQLRLPHARRVARRDRQPHRARAAAHRLGARRRRRPSRADGRAGQAERPARAGRTWPRSSRSATRSSTRRCCGRSAAVAGASRSRQVAA